MNNNNKKTQFAIASNTTDCICTAKIMGSQWHWKPCTFKSKIRCILEQSRRNHLGVYALIWIRLLTEWLSISNHENNCCLMILQASPPLVKTAWFWPNCSFCPYCNKCTVTSLACRCTVHCNLCQWVCVHACICPRRGDGSPAVIVPQSHSASVPVFFTLSFDSFGAVEWLVKYVRLSPFALEHRHTASRLLQLILDILMRFNVMKDHRGYLKWTLG